MTTRKWTNNDLQNTTKKTKDWAKRMPQETYTGQCSLSRCNNANTNCVYSDVIAFTIIRNNVKTGVVFLEYLAPSNISAVEATNYRYFL